MLRGIGAPAEIALLLRRGAESPVNEAPGTAAVQGVVEGKRELEVYAHRASICMSVEWFEPR